MNEKEADRAHTYSLIHLNTQTQDLLQSTQASNLQSSDTWSLFKINTDFINVNRNEEKETNGEQEIKTKDFLRKDKSFKNVFRAPKKYFLNLFKKNSKFFEIKSTSERKKAAQSEIENFVRKFVINMDYQNILNGLTMEDLVNIVGRIVIPSYMQKKRGTYKYVRECALFHDWVYRYNSYCASKLYQSKYNFKYILIIIKFKFHRQNYNYINLILNLYIVLIILVDLSCIIKH